MKLEPKFEDNGYPVVQTHIIKNFTLKSGRTCPEIRIGFCIFANQPDLPIVVLHPALTGSPRAWVPGKGSQGEGWFSNNIGKGALLDTDKYCIVCVDPLGGNGGSSSADELISFRDSLTLSDGIEATALFLQHYGISNVEAVFGGSIGGGQAFGWLFQNYIKVNKIFDISGSACRTPTAAEFFSIHADILNPEYENKIQLKTRLIENTSDLIGFTEGFDLIFNQIISNLDKVVNNYSEESALRVARQIGFLRFVTPQFYQNRLSLYFEESGDLKLAKDRLLSWLEYQADIFVPRFSTSSLRLLCKMDAQSIIYSADMVAEALGLKKIQLIGFSVIGDVLFPQHVQQSFYNLTKAFLSKDDQHLVNLISVVDEANGHGHFLTPHFAKSAVRLKELM